MTDRTALLIILVGLAFAAGTWLFGYQFLYWAFFDLTKPYLPEGSETVIVFVTGSMGAAFALVSLVVTAVVTYKVAQKSMQAGQDAALSTPGNVVKDGVVTPPIVAPEEDLP